jgi:hypothetical protein
LFHPAQIKIHLFLPEFKPDQKRTAGHFLALPTMTGKNRLRKTEATKTVLSARTSSSDRGHGVSKI